VAESNQAPNQAPVPAPGQAGPAGQAGQGRGGGGGAAPQGPPGPGRFGGPPAQPVDPKFAWPTTRTVLGTSVKRVDAPEKVTGSARYTFDITRPGMLYGKIVRSPHPHARVTSVNVDAARRAPGVKAVIVWREPVNADASTITTGPMLTGGAPPPPARLTSEVMFQGDEVAAVAADTEEHAVDAARLVKVAYEVLPAVILVDQALAGNAPAVFTGGNVRQGQTQETGDVAAGFKQAAFTIDQTYEVISQQTTHNVVGVIEGSEARLKDTYVLFGAHLDHLGYSQTGGSRGAGPNACRRRSPAAQAAVTAAGKTVQNPTPARGAGARGGGAARGAAPQTPAAPFEQRDIISNGADDDGSGSTALLAIAKAFATGPRPKRSIVVIWHAGEENGLYGSRFNADFPIVPLDRIQTELNIDMVGRDDCDNIEGDYSNTLFIVGADRISTDLHNVIVEANRGMRAPLTLDYELNDPQDPENIYTRSDHFSYASKGIPIAFFTTGLHPDYHRVTDTVDKIRFDKMARIAQLVYQTGFAIANSDAALVRDNKGARTGFASKAEVLK